MGMRLKTYKVIDHCPAYDQFSSVLYLKTTIEKIWRNWAEWYKYNYN